MGIVKTIKGEDGKPYISLEDFIREVENAKKFSEENKDDIDESKNFMDIVLTTLHNMEIEYYERYLFKKKE